MYHRPMYHTLVKRLRGPRRFIRSSCRSQANGKDHDRAPVADGTHPVHYASAERAHPSEPCVGRTVRKQEVAAETAGKGGALLVLDEIQKVTGWSEVVKRLWDSDTRKKFSQGSSPGLNAASHPAGADQPCRPVRDHSVIHWSLRRDARGLRVGPRPLHLFRPLSGRWT